VLEWLNGLPEVQALLAAQFNGHPVGKMNLSRWRRKGYKSWLAEQRSLTAVTALLEQSNALQESAKEGLGERMNLVLTAKMAEEIQQLDLLPEGPKKSKIRRELIGAVAILRRGDFHGDRLRVEREKLGFRRELHQREREAEFWQWIEKEEHRAKILDRLLTPEQNAEEIARRNQEKQRKIKDILGIPW